MVTNPVSGLIDKYWTTYTYKIKNFEYTPMFSERLNQQQQQQQQHCHTPMFSERLNQQQQQQLV